MRRALHVVAPSPRNPDADTLARIARGDLGGLGELYDRYARDLWRFVRRAAPNDDAEEVVHTVFERLVRVSGSYDARSLSARPWLFAVTARILRERRRSLRLRYARRESVGEQVRRASGSQLDDVSLRRLRQRTLEDADATLKSAPTAHLGSWGFIVAGALMLVLTAVLVPQPRAEYAGASATTAPAQRASLVALGSPVVVARQSEVASPAPSSERLPKSDPVSPNHPVRRSRSAAKSAVPRDVSIAPEAAHGDGITEDAAYLNLLALLEEGRKAEAVLAARGYLARFPDGFRRAEVRAVALAP